MTPAQLEDLLAALRRHATHTRRLEAGIRDAVDRDRRGGDLTADGYPAGGGGAGARGGGVSDPTFAAATARPQRDRHAEDTATILTALRAAVTALDTVKARLDLIASRTAEAPETARQCEWHAAAGHLVEPRHYGTVGGRLVSPVDLCGPCYTYAQRYGERPEFRADGRLARRVADSRSTVGTGGAFAWQAPR